MKFALIGYGKMGRMIEQIALSRGHEIVCTIDVDNREDFSTEAFRSADVAIYNADGGLRQLCARFPRRREGCEWIYGLAT